MIGRLHSRCARAGVTWSVAAHDGCVGDDDVAETLCPYGTLIGIIENDLGGLVVDVVVDEEDSARGPVGQCGLWSVWCGLALTCRPPR